MTIRQTIPRKVKPSYHVGIDWSNPSSKGLQAAWILNRDTHDLVSNDKSTFSGTTTPWVVAGGELAATFDGVDDYLLTTYKPTFGTDDFTIVIRLRTGEAGELEVIMSNGAWWFGKLASNIMRFNFDSASHESTTTVTDDAWYTVIVTRLNGDISVAVNGDIESTATRTGSNDGSIDLRIGRFGESDFFWTGEVSYVSFYNRGMGANEIRSLSNNLYQILQPRIQLVGLTSDAGVSAGIAGTMTASVVEGDIVTGGKTIIITLTNDTFVAAGTGAIGSTADTQALIDGFDAASSPTNGWNNEVRDKALTSEVVRTSNTVATWTVAAQSGYDVSAQETITGTIPAAVLTGAVELTASPTFTVDFTAVGGSIINQLQGSNMGADLFNGTIL